MVTQNDILGSIHAALSEILDPELPCSIVDLGLVETVELDNDRSATITLLPTFSGCPALDMITKDVTTRISKIPEIQSCQVQWVFEPAWTTDRISKAGRDSLKAHGVTVPEHGPPRKDRVPLTTSVIKCPFCQSNETSLDSLFGPTRCRMIYYCQACQNSFEHMKRIDL